MDLLKAASDIFFPLKSICCFNQWIHKYIENVEIVQNASQNFLKPKVMS